MSGATTLPNPVIPVERRCRIEEVFDQNFIELLRLVPRNPHVRALILKSFVETFFKLVRLEWDET